MLWVFPVRLFHPGRDPMANWHYKLLDALSTIAHRMASNEALPEPQRLMFSEAHTFADTFKHSNSGANRIYMLQALDTLCKACRHEPLYPCKEKRASFLPCNDCGLIRDHAP